MPGAPWMGGALAFAAAPAWQALGHARSAKEPPLGRARCLATEPERWAAPAFSKAEFFGYTLIGNA